MNPSTNVTLLFAILLLFISHAATAASPTSSSTKLYVNVCTDLAGEAHDHCLKLLETDPKITSAKDNITLCQAVLEMVIEKATNGQNHLVDLIKKYPSSQAIKDCATIYYDELVGSFKSALVEVVEAPSYASYDAAVAGDGPKDCDTALADEKKIVDPSISTLNSEMYFLSTVAAQATNLLPDDSS